MVKSDEVALESKGKQRDKNWEIINAADEMELKEALLHDESFLSVELDKQGSTGDLINKPLFEIRIPAGCLITLIRRGGKILVSKGQTVLEEGDRLTILGDSQARSPVAPR